MPKRRNRFERSDVPEASPYRSIMALLIVGIVAVAAYLLVTRLWSRVQLEDRLENKEIARAIRAQGESESFEGFHATDTSATCVLALIVDDLEQPIQLKIIQILVQYSTGRMTLVNVRPDTVIVPEDSSAQTLAELVAAAGPYELIEQQVKATNLACIHAIVATQEPWELLARHRARTTAALEVLTTDMDDDELTQLGAALSAVGEHNITRLEAPAHSEEYTAQDGTLLQTGRSLLYRADLGVLLGVLEADE